MRPRWLAVVWPHGSRSAGVMPDARVAAAAAHWGYRFTSNGTDYGDFTATLARIGRWDDWCREWGVTASHYERLAEAAEAVRPTRRRPTAPGGGPPRVALGQVRLRGRPSAAARRPRARRRLLPPGRRRADPARGARPHPLPVHRAGRLPARSRRPGPLGGPAGGDHGARPRLDQGGAPGHGRVPARPGDGHARDRRPGPGRGRIRASASSRPTRRSPPPSSTTWPLGPMSMAATSGCSASAWADYYAARAAAREKRLRAVVDLAGRTASTSIGSTCPRRPGNLPGPLRRRQRRRGAGQGRTLTLEKAAGEITTPLLILGGGRDRITPAYHQERLAGSPRPSWW